MNHNPMTHTLARGGVHLLFIAALVTLFGITTLPVAAQQLSTSDLAISIVSAPPKHAKACDTFEATYTITNLGPDNAANVSVFINIPDQFQTINVLGVPVNLAVGESATVTAVIKVVAFVPGESREAWVRAIVTSDVYPDVSIDLNPDNNEVFTAVKLISKQVASCP
jgi:uncharacterized protein DUF11